jgi:hypothetical protein
MLDYNHSCFIVKGVDDDDEEHKECYIKFLLLRRRPTTARRGGPNDDDDNNNDVALYADGCIRRRPPLRRCTQHGSCET